MIDFGLFVICNQAIGNNDCQKQLMKHRELYREALGGDVGDFSEERKSRLESEQQEWLPQNAICGILSQYTCHAILQISGLVIRFRVAVRISVSLLLFPLTLALARALLVISTTIPLAMIFCLFSSIDLFLSSRLLVLLALVLRWLIVIVTTIATAIVVIIFLVRIFVFLLVLCWLFFFWKLGSFFCELVVGGVDEVYGLIALRTKVAV